jgi:uncharacterized membrane protein
MDSTAALGIFFRWLHIATACVAVGSLFFMRVIVPAAIAPLDPEARQQTHLRLRRRLKMVIHPCILLFLISGVYNVWKAWDGYAGLPGAKHVIITHMVLAGIVFTLAIIMLAGPTPPVWAPKGMALNILLLLLAIAMGSMLKYMRDHPKHSKHATPVAAADAGKK